MYLRNGCPITSFCACINLWPSLRRRLGEGVTPSFTALDIDHKRPQTTDAVH